MLLFTPGMKHLAEASVGAFVMLATSCSTSGAGDTAAMQSLDLSSEIVRLADDNLILGRPLALEKVGESLLVSDIQSPYGLLWIDLTARRKMIPLLPIGEGPGEYDRVSVLSIFPGDYPSIGIYEANKNVFHEFTLGDTAATMIRGFKPEGNAWGLTPLANGRYVTIGSYDNHYDLFTLYDSEGHLTGRYGNRPMPDEVKDLPPVAATAAYQYMPLVSPDGTRVAAIPSMGEAAAFYKVSGDSLVEVAEFFNKAADADHNFRNGEYYGVSGHVPMGFIASSSNDKGVYILTSSLPMYNDKNEFDSECFTGSRIIVYDWDGNQTGEYNLDRRVKIFTAPDDNGVIYAITEDNCDPTIISFTIPGYND